MSRSRATRTAAGAAERSTAAHSDMGEVSQSRRPGPPRRRRVEETVAMIFDIVQAGDPVLRHAARAVAPDAIPTPFVQELVASMRQTMHAAPGVGLAAPQVGEALQVVVMEDGAEGLEAMSPARRDELGRGPLPYTVLINPVVEPLGDETTEFFEGCLSVSGFFALVRRQRRVRVRALDAAGRELDLELDGWPARIVQHEVDHLAGTLYLDRMDPRSFTTSANLGRYWKARPAAEIRAALAP
jgi:peptide deformylase